MNLRKRGLPPGWYPDSAKEIESFLFEIEGRLGRGNAAACVVPHAGWYFSGALSAQGILSLRADAGTVVVLGGHLGGGYPPLYIDEDGVETPLGVLEIDTEFREGLKKRFPGNAEKNADNTVEVELPMIKYFFPNARLVALRLPAAVSSYDVGPALLDLARSLKRRIVVIGSTDLTHYGPNYGFTPAGVGGKALEWVKNENDLAFINALLGGKADDVLSRANKDNSACSAGAVLGVLGYAQALRAKNAELLAYRTSADIEYSSSFVGYGVFSWHT